MFSASRCPFRWRSAQLGSFCVAARWEDVEEVDPLKCRLAIRYLLGKAELGSFTKSKWSLCLMLEFSWSVILEAVDAETSPAVCNF